VLDLIPTRRLASILCFSCTLTFAARPCLAQTQAPPEPASDAPKPSVSSGSTAAEAASNLILPPQKAPAFKDLFQPVSDFKRMVTHPDFAVLGFGAAGALMAKPFDAPAARAHWSPGMKSALGPGEVVGSFAMQTGGAFATYAIGRMIHKPIVATVGADMFRAQIITQATTQMIKFSANRTRPDGTTLSFPSGHSSASFATATVLQSHFGWKAGVPAYAMATWVAASRVQKDRHYVSDVIAGATIGILAGKAVTVGRGRAKFAMSPMPAPSGGGVGVSFTRIQK
jgi:membrane-associated phospholipid phosphatase